jgi:hypothetical protein
MLGVDVDVGTAGCAALAACAKLDKPVAAKVVLINF